jgi:ATP synthase I chain
MTKASADRMTVFVAALGLAIALGYLSVSTRAALSAGVGGVVGLLNFLALRYIVGRVVDGDMQRKAGLIGLIYLKMGGVMFAVYWVISSGFVAPIPFTVGLSSLVVGLIVSSLIAASSTSDRELAGNPGKISGRD